MTRHIAMDRKYKDLSHTKVDQRASTTEEALNNQVDKMTQRENANQPLSSATPEMEAMNGHNNMGIHLRPMSLLLLSNVHSAINRD